MGLEALSSNELLNFIIYDTISATVPYSCNDSSATSFLLENALKPQEFGGGAPDSCSSMTQRRRCRSVGPDRQLNLPVVVQGRKKRRRRPKVSKNKEEAETQRMTHITVERNRRKQMNDHLALLRSLMPESFVQRGDQASIVGGAIEFVKELEHFLQTLEAKKLLLLQQGGELPTTTITTTSSTTTTTTTELLSPPFAQFFAYPQYSWSQTPNKHTSKSKAAMADIEVTLIKTHANLRILSQRSLRQLSKMVAGFQTLSLTILHLNVTTLDPLVLYSISAKVEEGCQLTSADDIAGAVHHMLRMIEEEATLC
uniref:Putative transcription factor bHLH71 n=1 Tax=Davidia involucrata TaxID=16924 RepID=A0A5B6ZWZ3_DAVIN